MARFSQDVQFELFGRQKVQKERLEKRFGGSIPGGSWKRFSYPSVLNHISPYIYSFSGLQHKLIRTFFLQVSMSKFLSGRIQFCCFIFSRSPILAFWPPKIQKERLEKRFGDSTPGESWKMSIYKAKYGLVPLGKRIFSRTRQESSRQTFSQDALFGLFGGQKAQIGRLEKIEPPNLFSRCSFGLFGRQLDVLREKNAGWIPGGSGQRRFD